MSVVPQCTEVVLDAIRRRGSTVVRVHGRSMYPILRHGMLVEVQPAAYDELAMGDLVVFTNGQRIVCHRLIRKYQRQFCLKGDTNLWSDPPVIWSQVLGKVTSIIDDDLRVHQDDTPHYRRRASLLAWCSYPYAVYYNLMHAVGRCSWWSRGFEIPK